MRLAQLFVEAGLPAGVFNVVNGDKEAMDAILADDDIKAVGFVGSSSIAQYIYAGATGKRAQCFGGAKNHAIIMPDADMDQTVDALVGAGYGSAGERCMAISDEGFAARFNLRRRPRPDRCKHIATRSTKFFQPMTSRRSFCGCVTLASERALSGEASGPRCQRAPASVLSCLKLRLFGLGAAEFAI
jgi:hypothetical protein